MRKSLVLTLLIALVSIVATARAAEPLPPRPETKDKDALLEYRRQLSLWGEKNCEDLGGFLEATAEIFYETTRDLLTCELDDAEKRDINAEFAGILSYLALRENEKSDELGGAKYEELRANVARAGLAYEQAGENDRETLKAIYLEYARQWFALRREFALNPKRSEEKRDELCVSLIGDSITFALRAPEYGEDAYNTVLLVRHYSPELGEEAIDALFEAYEASNNPKLVLPLQKAMGERRFGRLPGQELYFEALFPDEKGEFTKKFNPEDHLGKVYLVEVWATWCGPCRKEIPRLKEVYAKYHDAGFEIFGYSIDQDLDALKKFVVENEIPWQVASQKKSVEAGYKGLYDYYAINGVPEMILVGRDGKVLQTDCRGVKLANALKELFPDVPPLDWKIENDFSARAQEADK